MSYQDEVVDREKQKTIYLTWKYRSSQKESIFADFFFIYEQQFCIEEGCKSKIESSSATQCDGIV